jgi:hypothetical protein
LSALQSELIGVKAALGAKVASLEDTVANLAHENLLLKRRLFGNKTERSHTSEMQLGLGDLLAAEARLQKELDAAVTAAKQGAGGAQGPGGTGERANRKAGTICSPASCRGSRSRSATRSWRQRDAASSASRTAGS